MNAEPQLLAHIRRLPLFAYLSLEQLQVVASAFRQAQYAPGDRLYNQGEMSQALYMFVSGGAEILHRGADGIERSLGDVRAGAYVGESSLFLTERRDSSVLVVQPSVVLVLTKAQFDAALNARPDIRPVLNIRRDLLNALQAQQQRGVRPDEMTLLITRRHPWAFAGRMLRSVLIFAVLVGLALVLAQLTPSIPALPLIALGLAVIVPALMALYYFFEWYNDFFIITNQRIIHEERYLLTGEEQREQALIGSIQNVSIARRGLIAELIGFGDVLVNTAGNKESLKLDMIPSPARIQKAIFDQIQRRREQDAAGTNSQAIQAQINALLMPNPVTPANPSMPMPPPIGPANTRQPRDPISRLFRSIFPPSRLVEGDRITYHKHWILLLVSLLKPLLLFVLLIVLLIVWLSGRLASLPNLPSGLVALIALGLFALDAFWFYWVYADWRDDTYVVDSQSIIDINRKPLWLSEARTQAGLQQIQNVTSRIDSLWGQFFDYGSVIIQTAAEHGTMVFRGIRRPTAVAEEILQRMQRHIELQAIAGQEEQRRLVAQYLAAYHQATQNSPQ
jgi:hypothetical protein